MTRCLAPDCTRFAGALWPPFCHGHWYRLPAAMQGELRRNAPREGRPQSETYKALLAQARDWLGRDDDDRQAEAGRIAAFNRRIMGGRD